MKRQGVSAALRFLVQTLLSMGFLIVGMLTLVSLAQNKLWQTIGGTATLWLLGHGLKAIVRPALRERKE